METVAWTLTASSFSGDAHSDPALEGFVDQSGPMSGEHVIDRLLSALLNEGVSLRTRDDPRAPYPQL